MNLLGNQLAEKMFYFILSPLQRRAQELRLVGQDGAEVRPEDRRDGVHHGGHHGQEGIENFVEARWATMDNFEFLRLYSCWPNRGGGRGDVNWEA